jgi:hypothetical protein
VEVEVVREFEVEVQLKLDFETTSIKSDINIEFKDESMRIED